MSNTQKKKLSVTRYFLYEDSGLEIRVHAGKLFFLFLNQNIFVGIQNNRLNETVLLSTHNTCLN